MNHFSEPKLEQLIAQRFLGIPHHSIACQSVQSGFSGAGITKVIAADETYALRRWTLPSLPEKRILELHRFLAHLKSQGLPVAVPISHSESRTTLLYQDQTHWQLEPWLSGEPSTGETINDSACQAMMRTLARLHLAAEKYICSTQGANWFSVSPGPVPAVVERIRLIDKWSSRRQQESRHSLQFAPEEFRELSCSNLDQFQRHSVNVAQQLQSLASHRCNLFPCWRDLWRDHVFFMNTEVSGLIDASATRSDHVGTDLSRLLGSLFGDDQEKWNIALSFYQEVRGLSSLDLQLISVLDRSSVLLSGITWIDRWQKHTLKPAQMPAIIDRLSLINDRMQNL